MTGFRHVGLALMLSGQTVMLQAQIAVSANDGKAVPTDMPDSPRTADTIAVLEIGRELGTDYLVESSLRAESSHLRITARLIRVRDQLTRAIDAVTRNVGP